MCQNERSCFLFGHFSSLRSTKTGLAFLVLHKKKEVLSNIKLHKGLCAFFLVFFSFNFFWTQKILLDKKKCTKFGETVKKQNVQDMTFLVFLLNRIVFWLVSVVVMCFGFLLLLLLLFRIFVRNFEKLGLLLKRGTF